MELPTQKYCRKKKNIRSKEKTMTMMHVPNDVIVQILSKLPAKSLLRFRWLCKYWFTLITDPYFVKMHLNNVNATDNPLLVLLKHVRHKQHTCEFHSLNSMNNALVNIKAPSQFTSSKKVFSRILGSCNGLLCIGCRVNNHSVFIWNPSTKQYKTILGFESTVPFNWISYGFGYDSSNDDYKVIRNACSFKHGVSGTLIDVYTLGTSSLKTFRDDRFYFGEMNGVSINGDIYWKASLTRSTPCNIIVAFDVAKEEFTQITSKPYINDKPSFSMHMCKLKGGLCVAKPTANQKSMEIWAMNHNADNIQKEYSWDMLYTIMDCAHIKPLKFCSKNEAFVIVVYGDIILYDPKSKQSTVLQTISGMMSIETYVESLVPIKGGSCIGLPSIDGPPIATSKRKREVKRPLRFQDEYY